MFLNYENGNFNKNTHVNPRGYFCTDILDFLDCVKENTTASISIKSDFVDALEDGSILVGFSRDTVESVYNAIVYG